VNGPAFGEMDVLIEQPELKVVGFNNLAAVRRFLGGNQTKDCRFARTVSSDETDLLVRIYLKRHFAQNIVSGVGF
jgi:hypothetical protein